jgi:hypothetical protein
MTVASLDYNLKRKFKPIYPFHPTFKYLPFLGNLVPCKHQDDISDQEKPLNLIRKSSPCIGGAGVVLHLGFGKKHWLDGFVEFASLTLKFGAELKQHLLEVLLAGEWLEFLYNNGEYTKIIGTEEPLRIYFKNENKEEETRLEKIFSR